MHDVHYLGFSSALKACTLLISVVNRFKFHLITVVETTFDCDNCTAVFFGFVVVVFYCPFCVILYKISNENRQKTSSCCYIIRVRACVCVCVCVRVIERERVSK